MKASTKFGGIPSTTLIVSSKSVAGFSWDGAINIPASAKNVLSGAMTANTLKTILSASGKGRLPLLVIKTMDGTSRTARVKITIDGGVAFDYTSAAIASSGESVVIIGNVGASSYVAEAMPITWKSSLLIELADSLSETDKIGIYYKYHSEN